MTGTSATTPASANRRATSPTPWPPATAAPSGPPSRRARRRCGSRSRHFGGAEDGAGADGVVGGLVDEDEAAGGAVAAVFVEEQGHGGAQLDAADLVERQGA